MALNSAGNVKAQALHVLDTVGNFVARGGEIAGQALVSGGRALQDATRGFESPAVRESGEIAARALKSVGIAVSSTFLPPHVSNQSSTNFQSGTASGFDAAFLLAGTVSSAIPGVHWVGAGATMTYAAMRAAPGLLAQWQGREDAQTMQSIQAGKLIMGAAVVAALSPPVVASLAFSSAMTVAARNAKVLISAE